MPHDTSCDERKHKNCAKDYSRAEDLLPVHLCNAFALISRKRAWGMSYGRPLLGNARSVRGDQFQPPNSSSKGGAVFGLSATLSQSHYVRVARHSGAITMVKMRTTCPMAPS
jgi:hypothetical protein